MQLPNANGYIIAVTVFLVCCWVNPNDAIPYRARLQNEEQADHRVGKRAEAVNVAHRAIGQPDLAGDKKPALSGGGRIRKAVQFPQILRSRNKGVKIHINKNKFDRISDRLVKQRLTRVKQMVNKLTGTGEYPPVDKDHEVSITSLEKLTIQTVNCSDTNNANLRYSSSFNRNSSSSNGRVLNVDDFQVAGEVGSKETNSVHVGEDITLCWIETTTIKEDHSVDPVQRFVIREYTISFENSATIPLRYLECVQFEGEMDGKNDSVPRSALFEVMDENSRHSRVVNFTTVSHTNELTVWQHKRVRCGVGPVVTKNIVEWADQGSGITKKRVEIKVSPKFHQLKAQPTDTQPCTTDLIDTQMTSSTSLDIFYPDDCVPGSTCNSYSDCVDEESCENLAKLKVVNLTNVMVEEGTTKLYTPLSSEDEYHPSRTPDTLEDQEYIDGVSASAKKRPELVTDEISESSESTSNGAVTLFTAGEDSGFSTEAPTEVSAILDDETLVTMSGFERPSTTEPSILLSVTLGHDGIQTDNQEKGTLSVLEQFNAYELSDSCESGESCDGLRYTERSTSSSEESSTRETNMTEAAIHNDDETILPVKSTTNVTEPTIAYNGDPLSMADWDSYDNVNRTETTEHVMTTSRHDADYTAPEKGKTAKETLNDTRETDFTTEEMDSGYFTTETTVDDIAAPGSKESSTVMSWTVESDAIITIKSTENSELASESTDRSITTTRVTGGTDEKVTLTSCNPNVDDCQESSGTTIDENKEDEREFEPSTTSATTSMSVEDSTAKSITRTDQTFENLTRPDVTVDTSDTATSSSFTSTDEITTEEIVSVFCNSGEDCQATIKSTDIEQVDTTSMTPETVVFTSTGEQINEYAPSDGISTESETTTRGLAPTIEESNILNIFETTSSDLGLTMSEIIFEVSTSDIESSTGKTALETVSSDGAWTTGDSTTKNASVYYETGGDVETITVIDVYDEYRTITGDYNAEKITEMVVDSTTVAYSQYGHESGTELISKTTDLREYVSMHTVIEDNTESTTKAVTAGFIGQTTPDYSIISSSPTNDTTEAPTNVLNDCDISTGECDNTEISDVMPMPSHPCDPELESCDLSCEETGDCSISEFVPISEATTNSVGGPSSLPTCVDESGDCGTGSTSLSPATCDGTSGDCSIRESMSTSTSISTTKCDEASGLGCANTIEMDQYSTTADNSEVCNDNSTGICIMRPQIPLLTDLPRTTEPTYVEVEHIPTPVDDLQTTDENRRSTSIQSAWNDPESKHNLVLKIKILLEHIDDNKNNQKLVEVEKHLLFDEHAEEHGNHSLVRQINSLNNSVDMETVRTLFNCSDLEKLTGDVGEFAAKYLAMHKGEQNVEGARRAVNDAEDSLVLAETQDLSHKEKTAVDPNVEISLPGIHSDIHSGLSHVMRRISSDYDTERRSVKLIENEDVPRSEILEAVSDPQDTRVHKRQKRQTIEDLMIDKQDLPNDAQEVGHWSNERVKRALNGGNVRTLTEFTIYKGQ